MLEKLSTHDHEVGEGRQWGTDSVDIFLFINYEKIKEVIDVKPTGSINQTFLSVKIK